MHGYYSISVKLLITNECIWDGISKGSRNIVFMYGTAHAWANASAMVKQAGKKIRDDNGETKKVSVHVSYS